MTELQFVIQLVISSLAIGAIFGRHDNAMRIYVGVWLIANLVLLYRYGVEGQLNFYSNDQRYYVGVIESVVLDGVPYDIDWWLTASRWPYTLPAGLLTLAGLSPVLAAKLTSLVFFLLSVRMVRSWLEPFARRQLLVGIYLTALGGIGVFFSVLALRETMMIYLVLTIFLSRLPTRRTLAFLLLLLLRQHLAVAVVIALFATTILRRVRTSRWTPSRAGFTVLVGNVIGYVMFSLGFRFLSGTSGVFGHQLGIRPVTRVFSNYFGLQFLTAFDESREFSLSSLIVSRLLFSETVVIPAFFTIIVFTSRRLDVLGRSVLLAFSIYVGLVTNTEFNSFRQNIPLMPVMGLVIARHLMARRTVRVDISTGTRGT